MILKYAIHANEIFGKIKRSIGTYIANPLKSIYNYIYKWGI